MARRGIPWGNKEATLWKRGMEVESPRSCGTLFIIPTGDKLHLHKPHQSPLYISRTVIVVSGKGFLGK